MEYHYQLASLTAGGPAPIIATLLVAQYHSYVPLTLYIILMAIISFLSAAALKEYANKDAQPDHDELPVSASVTPSEA